MVGIPVEGIERKFYCILQLLPLLRPTTGLVHAAPVDLRLFGALATVVVQAGGLRRPSLDVVQVDLVQRVAEVEAGTAIERLQHCRAKATVFPPDPGCWNRRRRTGWPNWCTSRRNARSLRMAEWSAPAARCAPRRTLHAGADLRDLVVGALLSLCLAFRRSALATKGWRVRTSGEAWRILRDTN